MKKFIIFIIIIVCCIFLYSKYIGIKGLNINEYKLNVSINKNYDSLKIVQLSDLHYNSTIKKDELKYIVNKINILNPDIVVITGDIYSNVDDDKYLSIYLKKINAKIGKYAIKGEYDLKEDWEYLIKESEFIDLNNKTEYIYNNNVPITISGISTIDDDIKLSNKVKNIYSNLNNNYYSILLVHEPDIIKNIDLKKFNLILAGHNHGGQIRLPYYTFKTSNSNYYYQKHYKKDNSHIYISYGLGTKNYNLRLFNKPSINFFRIFAK